MTGHRPWSEIRRKRFSSDVGDEHVERESQFPRPEMQEIGKPPTQPPPKPVDARKSVEAPAYRYKPNLERLSRRSFVEEGDRKIVEGMLKHTKPIVEQIRDPLVEKIVFPKADEIEYQYPYQDEAADFLYEFINSHVLKIRMVPTGMVNGVDTYRHEPTLCEHCKAKDALDLLNGIIQTQVQKLREYEEMMAIDHERITSLQQQLASCNVDLHNSKQHELGLMCGDLQYKLNEIKKLVEENRNIGLADFLAVDILEILES
jgi:hypothetical protein